MRAAAVQAKMALAPRRGLGRIEAAIYIGISPTKFDDMVSEGQLPTPRLIGSRKVWDIRDLDRAFDGLPQENGGGSWEGV